MLRVEHISKSWCGKPLLNNISFEVNSGECIVIFGKSGGGKSSLLKIIAGIELPDEGSILVDGEVQVKSNEQLIPGNPIIKLVNQDFSLDLYHRVEENIRLKILHLTHAEQDELCEELLDLMELTELRHEKALTLSGGEQQRLALARALALRPRYLLLDEPFAHLDFALKTRVEQYILTKKHSMGILLVTHDGREALAWGNRLLYMKDGKIRREDSPQNFYNHPENKEEGLFFGELNELTWNGKTHYIRPEMLRLSNDNKGIEVTFSTSRYTGSGFLCFGKTKQNEPVALASERILTGKHTITLQ